MVEISIVEDALHLEVQGWDKLWTLKSRLTIPLSHVRGVRADPEVAHGWWHSIRAPGTQLPGVITAGTFYQHGKRVFWDAHQPENTIVLDLEDERYDQLIVEVADPADVVRQIEAALIGRGKSRLHLHHHGSS
jgi:hypothetical protein